MTKHPIAAVLAAAAIALTAACGNDTEDPAPPPATSSAASEASESSATEESESSAPASTSAAPTDANGREILPDSAPSGFDADDTTAPFKYSYIVNYVNQYPGWIVLSTEVPEYDSELGGYRVNVYFSAYGGSDIILRDEFTMQVDGQVYQAEPLEPTGIGGTTDFLPDKTPIGNRPDALKNYAFGDVVFLMPETSSPLQMHYDNKDGDVHITWAPDGQG